MMEVNLELLREVPLFSNLTEDQLGIVTGLCSERSISAGQAIFKEGEPGEAIFVVSRGEVEILFTASGDKLACMEWVGTGDVLGLHAFFPPYKYSTTALSMTDGSFLVIEVGRLLELFQQDSRLAISILSRLIQAMFNRIAGLRSKT